MVLLDVMMIVDRAGFYFMFLRFGKRGRINPPLRWGFRFD
jgi:hypothetical protein